MEKVKESYLDSIIINKAVESLGVVKDVNKIEDFKNVKKIISLKNCIKKEKVTLKDFPNTGGVYAFWWIENDKNLLNRLEESNYLLKGSSSKSHNKHKKIKVCFDEFFFKAATTAKFTCLYIGKTTSLRKRISQHIMPSTKDRITGEINDKEVLRKVNSTSQLRIGLERIFKSEENILNLISKNVYVTYKEISGCEQSVNRFYAENKAIGEYYPLFNVDIER